MAKNARQCSSTKQYADEKVACLIITEEHLALLDPPVPAVISLLTMTRRFCVADQGRTGYSFMEELVDGYVFDIEGRLAFPAGLVPRVISVLENSGYEVAVEDQRKRSRRMKPDLEILSRLDPRQRDLVRAMRREPLGQIEVRRSRDALETCLMIGRVFRRARILVSVARRREARDIWYRMERRLRERVGLTLSNVNRTGARILVGTHTGIPFDTAEQWDILLLPYGEEATGERAVAMIPKMAFQRVYAFVAPRRRSDANIQLLLEMIAGPVISAINKPEAALKVVMVKMPPVIVANGVTALERKRATYWHNQDRNDRIAVIAEYILAGKWSALRGFGIQRDDIIAVAPEKPRQVAVLVESTEHGHELLALLPGWSLRAMNVTIPPSTEKNSRLSRGSIITTSFAAAHGIAANIIIRATGTEGTLRIHEFPASGREERQGAALVIDCDDAGSPRVVEDTRRRVQDYKKRGMTVVMAQPPQGNNNGACERNSSDGRHNAANRGGVDLRIDSATGNITRSRPGLHRGDAK